MNTDEILTRCRTLVRQGSEVDDVIRELRLVGLSKVQSMKVLVDLGLADLAGAKEAVHASAVWNDVRERDEDFHRRLAQSVGAVVAGEASAARTQPDADIPLRIALEFADLSSARPIRGAYNPELDNIVSILCDVCDALETSGTLTFEGFGRGRWWMDIRCDLSILLESLPIAIGAIAARGDFSIDLYEQGHEMRLRFFADGDTYTARALKLDSDQAVPGLRPETIDRAALAAMLTAVLDEFLRAVRELYPFLLDHPWLQGWLGGEPVW